MIQFGIQATVYFSHSEEETRELARAIQPMGDHIRAVGSDIERAKLRAILQGNHFRRSDVGLVRRMLLRAAKYARGHMGEYFPAMRNDVVAQAENLEDAVGRYHARFRALAAETIPVY